MFWLINCKAGLCQLCSMSILNMQCIVFTQRQLICICIYLANTCIHFYITSACVDLGWVPNPCFCHGSLYPTWDLRGNHKHIPSECRLATCHHRRERERPQRMVKCIFVTLDMPEAVDVSHPPCPSDWSLCKCSYLCNTWLTLLLYIFEHFQDFNLSSCPGIFLKLGLCNLNCYSKLNNLEVGYSFELIK